MSDLIRRKWERKFAKLNQEDLAQALAVSQKNARLAKSMNRKDLAGYWKEMQKLIKTEMARR